MRNLVKPRVFIFGGAALVAATSANGQGRDPRDVAAPQAALPLLRVSRDFEAPVGAVVEFDAASRERVRAQRNPFIERFPLGEHVEVDLELERFWVTNPATRFVVATDAGEQVLPLPDVALFKGRVAGQPHSQVFLSVDSEGSDGFIFFNGDEYVFARLDPQKDGVPGGSHMVYRRADAKPFGPPADFDCDTLSVPGEEPPQPEADHLMMVTASIASARQADIAVECDYEFRNMFTSTQAAANYVAALLGAVSTIYETDVNMRLNASYVRIWETSADPYSATSTSSALSEFLNYWNANMTSVRRNTAHFLSGKRMGGGIAYVNQMCGGTYAYGLSSSLNGTFPTPIHNADSRNWDLVVVAHELGHNFRSPHTHCYNPPVDTCYSAGGSCYSGTTTCQQGTIMSYCHLCGGMDNLDLTFGPTVSNYIQTGLQACIGVVSTLSTVFVDWRNTGTANGSQSNPYRTVTEGLSNVAPGGAVNVAPGTYDEPITITQPVTITAPSGAVSIG